MFSHHIDGRLIVLHFEEVEHDLINEIRFSCKGADRSYLVRVPYEYRHSRRHFFDFEEVVVVQATIGTSFIALLPRGVVLMGRASVVVEPSTFSVTRRPGASQI